MFKACFFAVLLTLPGLAAAVVHAQNETAIRPRRAQPSPTITETHARSRQAADEAKRFYKAGVKDGLAGRFADAVNNFARCCA